jgi:type II secretory ATPase GspE/PulE/Tfp pilus assembly ATPase PilB-like protein
MDMTHENWTTLSEALHERGLVAPTILPNGDDLAIHLATVNDESAEAALDWLAKAFKIVPLDLARPVCTTRAEDLFRRLAAPSSCDEPWMPFGSVGPLILCAHYNPACDATWEIPDYLIVRTLVSQSQYEALRLDIEGRLAAQPLSSNRLLDLPEAPPAANGGLLTVGTWLLDHYPFTNEEADKLRRCFDAFDGKDFRRTSDFKLLPRHYGVAFTSLARHELCFNPEHAPAQNYFPDTLLEKHAVYPLHCGKNHVFLLSPERTGYAFEDEWISLGHEPIEITRVLADRDSIIEAIVRNRGRAAAQQTAVVAGDLEYSDTTNLVEIDAADMQRLNPASINTSPEQVVHWILYRAITSRASDLHIEKYFNTARFRARIDGELQVIHACPEESLPRYISLIKNYSNMGQRRQDAQDARFALSIGKRRLDCRVSAIPCRKDLQKLTIRFLDKQDGVKRLSELNLSQRQLEIVQSTMNRDQGLVLVTGPTGSGKTTSLYAFINSINHDNINIHTIEDPIEYEIEGINQTQTDLINGIDFPQGLRRLLRADPDVILIGESRDEETANAAVNSALTGHLVLTTLHANDSLRAVSRLISMGVPPYLLADSLALSQAQRLVRRLCTYCKRPEPLNDETRELFGRNQVDLAAADSTMYVKCGCPECHDTGYSGRLALMEMCPITPDLGDLIAGNAPQSRLRETAFSHGVLSLYQEGLHQVLAGHTTLEEISCLSYTAAQ